MVDFSQIYEDAGKQYNIDPMLLQSIARVESGEGKNVGPSSAGALGVMQFMPDTAKQYGVDVNDPKSSIFGAAHYMSDLLGQTQGNLPQALAIYNGSGSDRSQTYPKQILTNYQQVQTQRQADLRASGQVSEAQPEPGIIDVGTPLGPAQPNTSGRTGTGGPDVASTLFGKGASTSPAAAPAGDVSSTLFGAPAAATPAANIPTVTVRPTPPAASPATPPAPTPAVAAAPAPAAPAIPPDVPVTPPAAARAAPEQAPQPVSAPAPQPVPAPTPQAPVQTAEAPAQPSWYQRNIGQPVAAMMDPTAPQPQQNYLLNSPTLQSLGSGVVQGTRDVAQTLAHAGEWVDARVPWMASLDRSMGYPEQSQLPTQTQAYNQQYGSDMAAGAGRLAGEIGTTYPVGWAARGASALAGAVPLAGRVLAPAAAGAVGGGAQNVLVSGGTDQDWQNALETGAAGGAALGGAFGAIGASFAGRMQQAQQQMADRLGIRLSVGQRAGDGSVAKRIEDTTRIMPGSGAAKFAEEQRAQIVRVIAREAGIPGPVQRIDTSMLNDAETRVGRDIENAARRITVPSSPRLMQDMAAIETAAQQAGTNTPQANTVRNLGSQLFNLMANNSGNLSGTEFARFISRGGPLDTALQSSVPEVRAAGNAIREALLNAAAGSGQGSADALRDLGRARYHWKVIQTVRPTITRPAGGTDEMNLPGLAQAIRNQFNMRMTGAGADMQDLSRLISGPLRTLPSSGTAERMAWQRWLGLGAEGAGLGTGGVAWALGHPGLAEGAITATGVPMAASLLAGRGLRYGPGLGINPLEAARLEFNPLLPRIMGPNVGNQLLLPAPQGQR